MILGMFIMECNSNCEIISNLAKCKNSLSFFQKSYLKNNDFVFIGVMKIKYSQTMLM